MTLSRVAPCNLYFLRAYLRMMGSNMREHSILLRTTFADCTNNHRLGNVLEEWGPDVVLKNDNDGHGEVWQLAASSVGDHVNYTSRTICQ